MRYRAIVKRSNIRILKRRKLSVNSRLKKPRKMGKRRNSLKRATTIAKRINRSEKLRKTIP